MAKLITMKCPSCGAEITKPDNRNFCYCTFCGTKVYFDDESVNINHHYYDEAKLEELRLQKEQQQQAESERMSKIAYEKQRWDDWFKLIKKFYIYSIGAIPLSLIIMGIFARLLPNTRFAMNLFSLAIAVLVFGPIYLVIERPTNTEYVPDKLLARHGKFATFFIFLGFLYAACIILGVLLKNL